MHMFMCVGMCLYMCLRVVRHTTKHRPGGAFGDRVHAGVLGGGPLDGPAHTDAHARVTTRGHAHL